MPRPNGAGRKAGTPNKKTQLVQEIADRLGANPFEVLCLICADKYKDLGYDGVKKTEVVSGQELVSYSSPISLDMRLHAAKEAAKYLYPQRRAIALSTDEESGFRVIIEDYTAKVKT